MRLRRRANPSFAEYYTEQVQEQADGKERASLALGFLFGTVPSDRALTGWCDAAAAGALFPVPAEEAA